MKTYDIVFNLLSNSEDCRNSDKSLIWGVWRVQGLVLGGCISWNDFSKAIYPESIRRCRQKIQELHPELQATSGRVRARRKQKQNTKGTFIFREDTGQGKFV